MQIRTCLLCSLVLIGALLGCRREPPRTPAIGVAFAGPATLNLRQEIAPRSPVVVTVKHGERLDIIQRRRRFIKLRTEGGIEGWTDERQLLTEQEIAGLRQFFEQSKKLPSQGIATTDDLLNGHTSPNRFSPSFLVIKAGEKVEVIGQAVTPRTAPAPRQILPAPPKAPPRRRATKAGPHRDAKSETPPPPMPAAPKPPDNWIEMSRRIPSSPDEEEKPVPQDDWALVRTASGESGWVLAGRLVMAIPDEVAQYAERKRITSYFPLEEVRDGDARKSHWLWTTIEQRNQPHQFDSFRVFIYSLRRHRYETAHIERNLTGYYPVLLHPVEFPKAAKRRGAPPEKTVYPGFSVLLRKKDGNCYRRRFALMGYLVRLAGEAAEPCPEPLVRPGQTAAMVATLPAKPKDDSWLDRLKSDVASWRTRWLGK